MANIFKAQEGFNNHPKRYNHDLSHKVYGSYKAGRIYPVFCQQLNPTESIRLDIASLLQFMPSIRPLQSNMRVVFHAFVNRNKNMQKNWPNCIEGLPDDDGNEVVIPYVLPKESEFRHDSLLNYLGVPTSKVVNGTYDFSVLFNRDVFTDETKYPVFNYTLTSVFNYLSTPGLNIATFESNRDSLVGISLSQISAETSATDSTRTCPFYVSCRFPVSLLDSTIPPRFEVPYFFSDSSEVMNPRVSMLVLGEYESESSKPIVILDALRPLSMRPECVFLNFSPSYVLSVGKRYEGTYGTLKYLRYAYVLYPADSFRFTAEQYNSSLAYLSENFAPLRAAINGSFDLSEYPQYIPFATREHPDRPIKLNAFPFRLYEGIYNGFYRNNHDVQQFMINGRPVYNRYNTNTGDGADTTDYDFFNRNWELDAYTSAVPSPQQGNPPIVGVSPFGVLTIRDDDGTTSTVQLQDLPDGQQGIQYSNVNLANGQHQQLFMSIANSGMTINDLRQANALQRFLETNMRKGYRYVDFLLGHFGKAPRHSEIDMPEFIGGCTVNMNADQVFNSNGVATAEDSNPMLGDVAGKNSAFGGSRHNISYYADDYCYLMVTMCIVPDNAYAQILPKHFLYHQPLDYAFPEFTQLGYQPIDYREFCPVEAYADSLEDNTKSVFDVFGYQRPNYDKIWHPDTLHGLFTTSLNRLAINRNFNHRPELSNEFLQIDAKDTIQPFADTLGEDDIAYGQIAFKVTLKTFIPRIVVPTIGK